ncbi:sensor protein PhoQ [mine drainage metagenome]|uniref:histidine kinase n=1 Tax=mine drainage metagenome TaxID=410659 RepID=A0A1J5TC38_9ZZZZ
MNELELAVIHDAKNNLGEVVLRLEARGDCFAEVESLIRASNSLTNLLLWHRQQAGAMRINVDSASPADLLNELVEEFSQFFPKLSIVSNTDNAPIFWFYDETYIRLALVNALHNACRFAKAKVQLSARQVDGRLVLTVQDDGAGYNAKLLEQQGQQQLAEVSRRGTGIGLALALSIASMHTNKGAHGKVMLRNDHGAVFELELP